jgi:branched-subunit amino acid transport protein
MVVPEADVVAEGGGVVTANAPSLWSMILAISIGTFLLRLSFVHWMGRREMSPAWTTVLSLVPAAVLCSLVLSGVLFPGGHAAGVVQNPRFWAAGVAFLVALRTRNVPLTLVVGMAALWAIRTFL